MHLKPNHYITCPKYRGQPKKHIDVCRKCRWRKNCIPYQSYWQPELPFSFSKIAICIVLLLFLANYSHAREPSYRTGPIVIQVIDLDHADADHLASILRPFLTKGGKIIPYRPTNSLVIKDRRSIVKELIRLIKGDLEAE